MAKKDSNTTQMTFDFVKIEGLKQSFKALPVDQISSNEELASKGMIVEPGLDFLDSLRTYGQIDPVLVFERANGPTPYELVHGSRRLRGIRFLTAQGEWNGMIMCHIIEEAWMVNKDILAMLGNSARETNEIADYYAIKRFLKTHPGSTLQDVRNMLNNTLTQAEIESRMKLDKLGAVLLDSIQEGFLTISTAFRVIKLSKTAQAEIIGKLEGHLDEIEAIRKDTTFSDLEKKQMIADIVKDNHLSESKIRDKAGELAAQALVSNPFGLQQSVIAVKDTSWIVIPTAEIVFAGSRDEAMLEAQKRAMAGERVTVAQR